MTKFFNWLQEFPSKRKDSPFRPMASSSYINELTEQNDLVLLNEAVRLSNYSSAALSKRGAHRLSIYDDSDATKALSISDITKALLLEPSNGITNLYAAIAYEFLGDTNNSNEHYNGVKDLNELTLEQILNLIKLQDQLNTGERNRRELLTIAIKKLQKEKMYYKIITGKPSFCKVLDGH